MEFREVVRALRKERDWSQEDVAERIGVNKMTISGYETGKRRPSFETLDALAQVFDVSFDYLLGNTLERGRYIVRDVDDPIVILSNLMLPDEYACFCAYRSAAPSTKAAVRRLLGVR